ncbi:MAG: putative lipoprotein YmbA [Pseudomonadales bacterium]|jgi:uncharacterized lipoprotein YmbA
MLLCSLFMMSACSSGPAPKLYLLEPFDVDAGTIQLAKMSGIKSLGMSPVELPGYASDVQIASLKDDGTVNQDDRNRWAEEPEEAITRLLSDRLRAHTEATVLIEPWPRDYEPMARVEVSFDKLLREPGGGAQMTGQILLLSGSGRKLLKAVPFSIRHIGFDTDSRVFFMAVAKGIDDIARMAVEEIQALKIKS